MKPHPHIRKTIKWGGTALTVLLAVVWIGSAWIGGGWCSPRGSFVWVAGGMLHAIPQNLTNYSSKDIGWNAEWNQSAFAWSLETGLGTRGNGMRIPLWMLSVAAGVLTAPAWYLDAVARRRDRQGKCPKCHYDRTGLPADAVCPECGRADEAEGLILSSRTSPRSGTSG